MTWPLSSRRAVRSHGTIAALPAHGLRSIAPGGLMFRHHHRHWRHEVRFEDLAVTICNREKVIFNRKVMCTEGFKGPYE
jgi:hypothetical protein